MKTVTIQLQPEAADALRRGEPTGATQLLLEVAHGLGAELAPLHPDVDDPGLGAYYTIEVADAEEAIRVVGRLQELDAVDAAFVKPEVAPP